MFGFKKKKEVIERKWKGKERGKKRGKKKRNLFCCSVWKERLKNFKKIKN